MPLFTLLADGPVQGRLRPARPQMPRPGALHVHYAEPAIDFQLPTACEMRMTLWRFFVLLCLLAGLVPKSPCAAAELDAARPFATSNQSPLVSIYGLPAAAPATVLAPGRSEVELRADLASLGSSEGNGDESLLLDGETYRLALVLRHGIGKRLEAGLEIPYVWHRGGFLDSFIIGWHNFFGLPQGDREDMPHERLAYVYEKDGEVLIDLDDETEGLGDVRLSLGWQLLEAQEAKPRALALRAALKLPTGDGERLLGSGSTDLALWLSGSRTFGQGSLALFGAFGGLFMTQGDVLPDQQRHAVAFGTLGGAWKPYSWLAFKVQVDGHSSFYNDSGMRGLSESLQLNIGGSLALSDNLSLDIAVGEDLIVESAPDIVFHVALRQLF